MQKPFLRTTFEIDNELWFDDVITISMQFSINNLRSQLIYLQNKRIISTQIIMPLLCLKLMCETHL